MDFVADSSGIVTGEVRWILVGFVAAIYGLSHDALAGDRLTDKKCHDAFTIITTIVPGENPPGPVLSRLSQPGKRKPPSVLASQATNLRDLYSSETRQKMFFIVYRMEAYESIVCATWNGVLVLVQLVFSRLWRQAFPLVAGMGCSGLSLDIEPTPCHIFRSCGYKSDGIVLFRVPEYCGDFGQNHVHLSERQPQASGGVDAGIGSWSARLSSASGNQVAYYPQPIMF